MEITYKNCAIKKICGDVQVAEKKFGRKMANKIHRRIDQIAAAQTVEELIQFRVGRCHLLIGDRKGEYAMDLVHPMRLIFKKRGCDVQIAHIVEIEDYH